MLAKIYVRDHAARRDDPGEWRLLANRNQVALDLRLALQGRRMPVTSWPACHNSVQRRDGTLDLDWWITASADPKRRHLPVIVHALEILPFAYCI